MSDLPAPRPETPPEPRPGLLNRLGIALIRLYQVTLGPILGGHCRYTPSCSFYGLDAMRKYGFFRACFKTAARILRCHPWAAGGHDPA